jgi:Flp pilus assembly pilin Flp
MAIAAFTYNSTTSFLDRITCTRQRGQGLVEYAFILVLIALVVIVMLITTGGQIRNMYSDITYTLNNQAGL